ncbi:hypothetical protein CEP54_014961 [Fusarium duplospermum]|uniref:Amidohydrolase-related domain-containing protein n=1 Tax=Fusarium duplospermum TaxID=1325734 RepID=A0A428NSH3_9HYPO|nr:hypothetical protein CEP54_014961 [Fusarium duplospermum]
MRFSVALLLQAVCLVSTTTAISPKSTLFTDGTVIAFNKESQENEILYNTSVLVVGDTIVSILPNGAQGTNISSDTEIIPVTGMIISPGFIDTHRHTWQTIYRTLASNITLAEYFSRYSPFSEALGLFSPEDFYLSQMVGIFEALNAGVTSLLDHSHNLASTEDAAVALDAYLDSGARVWFGYNFDPVGNFSISDRLAHFQKLQRDPRLPGSAVEMGISCDSWGAMDEKDLCPLVNLVRTGNISVLTSHWLDGIWNVANSPSLFNELELLNQSFPIVLSHATFLQQPEYELLRKHNQYISITPESEMHFGHTNQESDFVMDQSSLGVDTHATYSGDIVTQARLWLQSVRHRSFRRTLDEMKIPRTSPMSVNQAFHLATRGGAQALRREDLGIIAVGAKADIVAFEGNSTNMIGWKDPIAAVILHSNVGDVKHVMVHGKMVKKNGLLTVDNLNGILSSFSLSAKRIQEQAVELPYEVQGGYVMNPEAVPGYPERLDAVRGDKTGY